MSKLGPCLFGKACGRPDAVRARATADAVPRLCNHGIKSCYDAAEKVGVACDVACHHLVSTHYNRVGSFAVA
jgi:hypothetical protein